MVARNMIKNYNLKMHDKSIVKSAHKSREWHSVNFIITVQCTLRKMNSDRVAAV